MKPVKDKFGDLTVVKHELGDVFVRAYQDQDRTAVPRWTVMRYTPKQARKLAKQLKRAARKAEA